MYNITKYNIFNNNLNQKNNIIRGKMGNVATFR